MQGTEFETDEMLKLLTEALRRGPGSPEWHEAVERLRASGAKEADDFRLLMTVRERLESGQSYREVRAGPAFTRELMQRIDEEPDKASGKQRTILIVSLVCIALLIGSVAILVTMMSNGQPRDNATEQLAQQLFVTPVEAWTFDRSMPEGFDTGGEVKLEVAGGLRLAKSSSPGLGSAWPSRTFDLRGGICVEAQVQYHGDKGESATLVVGTDATAKGAPGLALSLIDEGFAIVNTPDNQRVKRKLQPATYTMRMKINEKSAVFEIDGQVIWSGTHALPEQVEVVLGLEAETKPTGNTRVHSLRILKP